MGKLIFGLLAVCILAGCNTAEGEIADAPPVLRDQQKRLLFENIAHDKDQPYNDTITALIFDYAQDVLDEGESLRFEKETSLEELYLDGCYLNRSLIDASYTLGDLVFVRSQGILRDAGFIRSYDLDSQKLCYLTVQAGSIQEVSTTITGDNLAFRQIGLLRSQKN